MNEAHASTFAHYFTMLEASQETANEIGRLLANVLSNRFQDTLLCVLGQCMRDRLVATQDKLEPNPNYSSLSPRWGKGRSKYLRRTGRLHASTLHHLFLELGFTDFDAGEIARFLCARAGDVDKLKELLSKVVLEKKKLTAPDLH
jgi:hypothetical protein